MKYLAGCAFLIALAAILTGCQGSSSTPIPTNTAPNASFTVTPGAGNPTTSFAVDASGCTDAEDPTIALQVRWSWESDGNWTSYTTAKTATHRFATTGNHTITVEVKDTEGLTSITTRTITVSGDNTAPTAAFTVNPSTGNTSTNFTVDASGSVDAQDATTALQVRWDWESDGNWTAYTTTKTASHTYATNGAYTITLEVKDSGGLTSTTTHTVDVSNVANTAPSASFNIAPASGTTTTLFVTDASGSTDAQDASSALMVRWDWESNGTWTPYSTNKIASHIFTTTGNHTITLEVKDSGGLTDTATRTVAVSAANAAPTASFTVTPNSGTTSTNFAVNASGSSDAEDAASALQVRWDWESDGTWTAYTTTKTASHTYASAGSHTITLQVKDTGGVTATTTRTVSVASNNGPKLSLSLDASLNGDGASKVTAINKAELLNTSGAVVGTATLNAGIAQFDLTGISAGTYFIRVNDLADDLVPSQLNNTSTNITQYVGAQLRNSVIGSLADPTYRIKTFSLGQSQRAVAKYSNGSTATPTRYAYTILSLKTSPQKIENRVLGSGALLVSYSGGHHSFATWMMGSNNHGTKGTTNCGCHGNLDSHPASHGSIKEDSGWCFKCHYSKAGTANGMVDPAQ